MIVKTDAIVLKSMEYGETSRIVTLFTRDRGKVSVIAKGARAGRSRFGSTLQPMSHTQVLFYYKPARRLHTLSESSHIRALRNLARDMNKIAVGLRVVELLAAVTQEEDAHPELFDQVVAVLYALDGNHERVGNVLPFFQLRLAAQLGFSPSFTREAVGSVPASGGMLSLSDGEIGRRVEGNGMQASRAALRAFAVFARADLPTVLRMRMEKRLSSEVQRLIEAYLRYHIERSYPNRVAEVVAQLRLDVARK